MASFCEEIIEVNISQKEAAERDVEGGAFAARPLRMAQIYLPPP